MKCTITSLPNPHEQKAVSAFVNAVGCASYHQDPLWADYFKVTKRHNYELAVVREGDQILATAVIRWSKLGLGKRLAALRRGPVTENPALLERVMPVLLEALRDADAVTVIVSPRWEADTAMQARQILSALGATELPRETRELHRSTALIDLTGDPEGLAANFKQRCRRQIKKAAKLGMTIRPAESVEDAIAYGALMDAFHHNRGLSLDNIPPVEAQYEMTRERGVFLLGYHEDQLIAGHTAIAVGQQAFWLTMASLDVAPSLPKNYPLLAEALRICASQGLQTYDMAGAPSAEAVATDTIPEAEKKRFDFKSAFNPNVVDLVPPMVFAVNKPAHKLLFSARQSYRRYKNRNA